MCMWARVSASVCGKKVGQGLCLKELVWGEKGGGEVGRGVVDCDWDWDWAWDWAGVDWDWDWTGLAWIDARCA